MGAVTTSAPVAITIGSAVTQVYYIYADHLNTPRQVVDSNNQVVWEWRQDDPFGNNVRFPLFFVFQQVSFMQLVFPDSAH